MIDTLNIQSCTELRAAHKVSCPTEQYTRALKCSMSQTIKATVVRLELERVLFSYVQVASFST